MRAGADALHVVFADVEVGHGAQPAELDRSDVVRLRGLLLCAYGFEENDDSTYIEQEPSKKKGGAIAQLNMGQIVSEEPQ
jgi:hypothetical protein